MVGVSPLTWDDLGERKRTPLEEKVPILGFEPWDPNLGSYDDWEHAFIDHCTSVSGFRVETHRHWFHEQGFRPHILDEHVDPIDGTNQAVRDKEKGRAAAQWVGLYLVLILISIIVYFVSGRDVECAVSVIVIPTVVYILLRAGYTFHGDQGPG